MTYGSVLADTLQSSTAGVPPQFNDGNGVQIGTLCRAWVKFTPGATPAINGQFNVSSITRQGTGYYTVNFATAMPDANYAPMLTFAATNGNADVGYESTTAARSANSCTFWTGSGGTAFDASSMSVAIFR